jgi:tRNA modification GTPase
MLIIVGNKADVADREKISELVDSVQLGENEDLVFISAKKRQNLDSLIGLLKENAHLNEPAPTM